MLLFTPRLVGKNAGVHPAARGIVPLLRSAYPQSAATMRWWIFLDDFVQYSSSSFDAMSVRQKRGLWTNARSRGLPSASLRRGQLTLGDSQQGLVSLFGQGESDRGEFSVARAERTATVLFN